MAIEYNFKYMPLVGKLSGQSMVQQTETAINEIAKIVNDNTAQAEIINTLAEEANTNSVEALEKANEAIETSSRYYVYESSAVNLNDYCEAQLIYINNAFSQNLPIAHKGFLEVKTNSNKTQATQVFADNVDRKFYVRTGGITATEVGDVTTYTASYGDWTNIPNSTDLANYLPLAGGTMSGDIEYSTNDFKINSTDINNDGEISVVGATDNLNGASLDLYGRNHTEAGSFELNANNGTLTKTLKGDASGDLTWDGDVTADNFVGNVTGNVTGDVTGNADTATNATNDGNGNQIDTTYLPKSGGTMTGYIKWVDGSRQANLIEANNNLDIGWLYANSDGAGLGLRGADNTDSGEFFLYAKNANNSASLSGKPTGELIWRGISLTDGSFLTARIVSTGTNPTAGSNVTAPAVSGYQFVCWVMSASQGNVIPSYIQNATSNPGRIWYSGSAAGVYFDCTALYVRKW